MLRWTLACLTMTLCTACGGRNFTNLGNGIGVPNAAIEEYAETRGISFEEARARMRADADQQRAAVHDEEFAGPGAEAQVQPDPAGP